MKRFLWILTSVLIIVLFCAGVFGFLYQYAGLNHYLKAITYIRNVPAGEKQQKAWSDFYGENDAIHYGGLLGGVWANRIWVWGRIGLRSFPVDQYSVFSFYDGCTEAIKETTEEIDSLIRPELLKPSREVYPSLSDWSQKSRLGDWVNVIIADADHGGTKGHLREIYTYNYWPFMQQDIHTQCAK
jgi:hypothetical protein